MSRRVAVFVLRVIVTGAGAGVATAFTVDRSLVVRVYLLVVGGLALDVLVRSTAQLQPERPRLRLPGGRRGRQGSSRPAGLVRLEDQVALAGATAADLYFRLRPVLREIAEERAAAAGSASLDAAGAGAAWELLRHDLEPPRDPFARGLPPARLAAVVDAIERL